MGFYLGSNVDEARAVKYLSVFAVAPILILAFQDLGSKYGNMDWLTRGYAAWPTMIAPLGMLVVFIVHRELIRRRRGDHFAQTLKMCAIGYALFNLITIAYSWLAAISVIACAAILVACQRMQKQSSA
ncbi:hypothetical protein [Streptomyces boninensis]|uniref:hypothetical protein n=1 Tax=Streptomyces boninensis TaxID=2039455 RepID=UPI003B210CFD